MHVWRASLNAKALPDDVLDNEERAKAARFVKEEHRTRYAMAQTILRHLLGRYTGLDPKAVAFTRGPQGKPYLPQSSLQFNITHSGDLLLAAFCTGQEVGVDVEKVEPKRPVLSLARRYYTPSELDWLKTLDDAVQARAFFQLWTLKEAFLKARGTGLSGGLNTFEYRISHLAPPELLWTKPEHGAPGDWSSITLNADEDYAAALVVTGTLGAVKLFEWTE